MLGRGRMGDHEIVIDHTALFVLEDQHDITPESVFRDIVAPKALRTVVGVALQRAKECGLAEQVNDPSAILDQLDHRSAVRSLHEVLYRAVLGREMPPAQGDDAAEDDDESAEGKRQAPPAPSVVSSGGETS